MGLSEKDIRELQAMVDAGAKEHERVLEQLKRDGWVIGAWVVPLRTPVEVILDGWQRVRRNLTRARIAHMNWPGMSVESEEGEYLLVSLKDFQLERAGQTLGQATGESTTPRPSQAEDPATKKCPFCAEEIKAE